MQRAIDPGPWILDAELITLLIGNSHVQAARWAVSRPGAVARWSSASASLPEIRRWLAAIAPEVPLVVASVVPSLRDELLGELRSSSRQVFRFRADLKPGLQVVPRPASAVGDDRLAAALGALSHDAACPWIVVDAGTALTVNAVRPGTRGRAPRFEGGAIVPGEMLALAALAGGTAQLPALAPLTGAEASRAKAIGRSTAQAIRWGVWLAQAAALRDLVAWQRAQLGPQSRVLLTGGGAPALEQVLRRQPELRGRVMADPLLVLRGLWHCWQARNRP